MLKARIELRGQATLAHADVGISVDQAVDVARDSAEIVLLERDFGVLAEAILDGRRTFANLLKYITITTSANFGNMISMAIGTMFLPFLPMTPAQILLNNFLSDMPSLALAGDRVDPKGVLRAPRWDMPAIRRFMFVLGLLSTCFDLLAFAVLDFVFRVEEITFHTAWFMTSLLSELGVPLVLRTRRSVFQSRPGGRVLALIMMVAVIACILPSISELSGAFGFGALPPPVLASVGAIVLCYLLATEGAKTWYFAHPRYGGAVQ